MSVYIIYAKRTPIGSFLGSLSTIEAHKMSAELIKDAINKNVISNVNLIDEVILGQTLTAACGQNPARQASIGAGLPYTIPAATINQVCGSGMKAIILGANAIKAKEANCVIVGGQENMSLSKHATYIRKGTKTGNIDLVDTMLKDGLTDAFYLYHMGNTAENLVQQYNISRTEQDEFAYLSQMKATNAQKLNKFKNEIMPLSVQSKKEQMLFDTDEFIKSATSLESLHKLKPSFKENGTVTPGNASGINDGAAVLILASEEFITNNKIKPIAKIISYASAGVDPSIMGISPVQAVKSALKKAEWSIDSLELIESNEAFAAQSIALNKELNWNQDIINVNGGAIALGHPIGASGARIVVTLLYEMERRQVKRGLASLCIGGGMGIAICIEL